MRDSEWADVRRVLRAETEQWHGAIRGLGDGKSLLKDLTEDARVGDQILSGATFPAALVLEALRGLPEATTNLRLEEELQRHLQDSFAERGFAYFTKGPPLFPEDLDTAATLTRVLGLGKTGNLVRQQFMEWVENELDTRGGSIQTWRPTRGFRPVILSAVGPHAEVVLNAWLTLVLLGRKIELNWLYSLVRRSQLVNYWYVPDLYASFCLMRVVLASGFGPESTRPLLAQVFERVKEGRFGGPRTLCEHPAVRAMQVEPDVVVLNQYFEVAVGAVLCLYGFERPDSLMSLCARLPTRGPSAFRPCLYWTVGFRPYRSAGAAAAMVLLALETANTACCRASVQDEDRLQPE